MCFTDLGKLNCVKLFNFELGPVFFDAPAAFENDTNYKSGQNWLKNNPFDTLI